MIEKPSVTEKINQAFEGLSSSEKRVARSLLTNYPFAALESVNDLSNSAGVSSATTVRFVQALGYGGFREFQQQIKEELQERQNSAASLATLGNSHTDDVDPPGTEDSILGQSLDSYIEGIKATFKHLRKSEVHQTVEWLSNSKMPIIADGGDFSKLLAHHLTAQLSLFRAQVATLPSNDVAATAVINGISAKTLWVTFDFRRYDVATERRAKLAKDRNAKVVLVTDRWLSPIATFADVVLSARVAAHGPSDTLVPAMALVEALCEEAADRTGESGLSHLKDFESLRSTLRP